MWEDILKAPYIQPFERHAVRQAGPIRPDDKKLPLVGLHPLPLIGSYGNLLHQILQNKNKEWSLMHWWVKGRIPTTSEEIRPKGDPEQRYVSGPSGGEPGGDDQYTIQEFRIIKKLENYMDYRRQDQPPSWEEFVSKIDDQDEFKAASVIFGKDFPKDKQDLTKVTQPSWQYRTESKQRRREQNVLTFFKQKYDTEVERVYEKAHNDFQTLIDKIREILENYVQSEQYRKVQNPRLKGKMLLLEQIKDLKGEVNYTNTTHGINLWWKPDWYDVPDNFLLRIKMNITQPDHKHCIDEYREDGGRKRKIRTVCLTGRKGFVTGDTYASILLAMDMAQSKKQFQQMISQVGLQSGGWHWQSGNVEGSDAPKYMDWQMLRTDTEGRFVQTQIARLVGDMLNELDDWGRYWVKEV